MSDAFQHIKDRRSRFSTLIPIPAVERLKQLYCLEHSSAQMAEILNQEFGDLSFTQYTTTGINQYVLEHREEFDNARTEMSQYCKEELQQNIAMMFVRFQADEIVMADALSKTLRTAAEELRQTNLSEKDEKGNYTKTSRVFSLLEILDKTESKLSKLTGSAAMKEVEMFRLKMQAKQAAEGDKNALIPQAKGQTVESTIWV